MLLSLQSHLTFFVDDWEFLLRRQGIGVGVFLNPYNDHIVVAPTAIYKSLLAVFGMSSAMPFDVVSTLLFLLSVVLLFIYLRRRVGDWPAFLGSVLILFLGAAWTDLLWSIQMVFTGSVAAGIGALLALDRDDRKGDLVACALLVVATSFSELAVPFLVGALVSIGLAPSPRRRRLYVALVPFVLYGIWYVGWGHKAGHTESFHNLVSSPKFVFDTVSQNVASLLGLATPLSPDPGIRLVGLNWGRILLMIAAGVALLRLRRTGWPSRRLWAVLAAGAAYWFLTALNAAPLARTPVDSRYQYPGAIFVLLIAAELLRGARIGMRAQIAATAVAVGAAVSGLIFLHDGYELRTYANDSDRAKLAALEIGRGRESRDFPFSLIGTHPPYTAASYFSAADAFGSPAFSEAQLAASDEANRVTADQLLAQGERIGLTRSNRAADPPRSCYVSTASQSASVGSALRPGVYILSDPSAQLIQLARFADGPSVTVGSLGPGSPGAIRIPSDRSNRRWRLYSQGLSSVTVCRSAGKPV